MPPKPKRVPLEAIPETCGSCRFARDVSGQEYLLCYGPPSIPLLRPDGEITWHRGGEVEPSDPACSIFEMKGRT